MERNGGQFLWDSRQIRSPEIYLCMQYKYIATKAELESAAFWVWGVTERGDESKGKASEKKKSALFLLHKGETHHSLRTSIFQSSDFGSSHTWGFLFSMNHSPEKSKGSLLIRHLLSVMLAFCLARFFLVTAVIFAH